MQWTLWWYKHDLLTLKKVHLLLINIHVLANVNVDVSNLYVTCILHLINLCCSIVVHCTKSIMLSCMMIAKVNYLWYVKSVKNFHLYSTFYPFLINCIQAKSWCLSPKLKHFQFQKIMHHLHVHVYIYIYCKRIIFLCIFYSVHFWVYLSINTCITISYVSH